MGFGRVQWQILDVVSSSSIARSGASGWHEPPAQRCLREQGGYRGGGDVADFGEVRPTASWRTPGSWHAGFVASAALMRAFTR